MKLFLSILIFILSISIPSFAQENTVYIWQRNWQPEVLQSIDRIKPICDSFTILGGDFKLKDNRVESSKVFVNWEYLESKGPVTVSFRIHKGVDKILRHEDISSFVNYVANLINNVLDEARQKNINIIGVQIDYDCPTSKLSDFTRFIKELKTHFTKVSVSITALPTWMNNDDFPALISATDYYVLQLHSFEIPKGNDKEGYIFPKDRALDYFSHAINLNRPFYLSLPTYGYEVAYTNEGKFLGLRAEGGVEFFGNNIKQKLMFADSNEILKFINMIKNYHSSNYLGICWFRLPVKSDRFNWDIKTLERVIRGQPPRAGFEIKTVNADNGVKELYLINTGEVNVENSIEFDITWQDNEKPLYDILSDFTYLELGDHKGLHIVGKPPMVDQRKFVGWVRADQTSKLNILPSEVMINEAS